MRALLEAAASRRACSAPSRSPNPTHGSDLGSITTRARRDGDEWVINGTKRFITNGGFADFYTVLARTGGDRVTRDVRLSRRSRSARRGGGAVGEQDGPARLGHRRNAVRRRAGAGRPPHRRGRAGIQLPDARVRRGSARCGCDVPRESPRAPSTRLPATRPNASNSARRSLRYQGVQFLVADMAIGVYASRAIGLRRSAGGLHEHVPDASRLAAIAKTFASDMCDGCHIDRACRCTAAPATSATSRSRCSCGTPRSARSTRAPTRSCAMLIARTYFGELAR